MRMTFAAIALIGLSLVGTPLFAQTSAPAFDENSAAFKEGQRSAERAFRTMPEFRGSHERWTCTWMGNNGKPVIVHLGIYSGYALDDFDLKLITVLDSQNALIVSDSSYGEKDIDGNSITQITRTFIIDRRDYSLIMATTEPDATKDLRFEGACSKS